MSIDPAGIPQADDLDKLVELILLVGKGISDNVRLSRIFSMTSRQVLYYARAGESLGLVTSEEGHLLLSDKGRTFVNMGREERNGILVEQILSLEISKLIINELMDRGDLGMGKSEISDVIRGNSGLGKSTSIRRSQTIWNYFTWISRKTGTIVVRFGRLYLEESTRTRDFISFSSNGQRDANGNDPL